MIVIHYLLTSGVPSWQAKERSPFLPLHHQLMNETALSQGSLQVMWVHPTAHDILRPCAWLQPPVSLHLYRKQTKPCRRITKNARLTPPERTSSQNQIPIGLPSRCGHAVTQASLANNSLKTQWLCKKFYHALKMFKALLFNWMAVRKPRPLEGFSSGQTTAEQGEAATLEVILTTFVGWVLLNKQKSSIQIVNGTRGTRWNKMESGIFWRKLLWEPWFLPWSRGTGWKRSTI